MDISLKDKVLVSVPFSKDPIFSGTVIYMCSHNETGAMGIVVNRRIPILTLSELKEQLGIRGETSFLNQIPVLYGGPVEEDKGLVLHSSDYEIEGTKPISSAVSLTSNAQAIRDIYEGKGPSKYLFVLGYAGWSAGQLEGEMKRNFWLYEQADEDIIFNVPLDKKWGMVFDKMGVNPDCFSLSLGVA